MRMKIAYWKKPLCCALRNEQLPGKEPIFKKHSGLCLENCGRELPLIKIKLATPFYVPLNDWKTSITWLFQTNVDAKVKGL